jgi:SHS2 domain-containing protein
MERSDQGFELLEHTADAGVRAWGRTPEAMYQAAARGLYALALAEPPRGNATPHAFSVAGATHEERLVRLLAELVYLLNTRDWAATDLRLLLGADGLDVSGQFVRVSPEEMVREIKSPTYHLLEVREHAGQWTAEVYFDL